MARRRRSLLILRPRVPPTRPGRAADAEPAPHLSERYHAYERATARAFRWLPWLFAAGLVAVLAVHVTGAASARPRLVDYIALATLWPALLGWMLANGVGIVWALLLSRRHATLAHAVWWLVGILFVAGPLVLLAAILRRVFA